jgi:hypothetical protein
MSGKGVRWEQDQLLIVRRQGDYELVIGSAKGLEVVTIYRFRGLRCVQSMTVPTSILVGVRWPKSGAPKKVCRIHATQQLVVYIPQKTAYMARNPTYMTQIIAKKGVHDLFLCRRRVQKGGT